MEQKSLLDKYFDWTQKSFVGILTNALVRVLFFFIGCGVGTFIGLKICGK